MEIEYLKDSSEDLSVSRREDLDLDMASQQATQPLYEDLSDITSHESNAWGYLFPNLDGFSKINLDEDVISFGRSTNNNYVFLEKIMGKSWFIACSKVHFKLTKKEDVVYLEDWSSNGTFINGLLVGKGKKMVLEHNSYISIAEAKRKPFIFMKADQVTPEYPEVLTGKYVVSRELGKGACGTVRLGFRVSDNERFAIKIIDKKQRLPRVNIMNEVKILKAVKHPCIIRLEDVVDTDSTLYIILELADGGELFDKIVEKTKFNETEAKFHFIQIASAIKYLHSKKIAHRDLKPENILLSSNFECPLIKITDMGLSKLVNYGSDLKTFCGTPQYLAPEILISLGETYTYKVDCWSMGVVLYILLCGRPPFSPDEKELVRQIVGGKYVFGPPRLWAPITPEAIDLIKKLMVVDPNERLSAAEVLQHPWITSDPDVLKSAHEVMWPNKEMISPRSIIKRPKIDDDNDEQTSNGLLVPKISKMSNQRDFMLDSPS